MAEFDRRRLLGMVALACAAPSALAKARPVLLIFPAGQSKVVPASTSPDGKDGLGDVERISEAARIVRNLLEEEGAVTAVLFQRDAPGVARAVVEARVAADAPEYNEEQKLRIAVAYGAHYAVSITARGGAEMLQLDEQVGALNAAARQAFETSKGAGGAKGAKPKPVVPALPAAAGPTLEIDAVEVKRGGKRWRDRISIASSDIRDINDLAAKRQAYPTALATAARSLVIRFLNGPLRDARLAAVDKSLLPPPQTPEPAVVRVADVDVKPEDPAAEVAALMQRSEIERRDGQPLQALATLRLAVSTNPRSPEPRLALVRAYLDGGLAAQAADEARRALSVVDAMPVETRREFLAVVARTLADNRDPRVARTVYEKAVKDDPENGATRLSYAELLLAQGDTGGAEVQYRILRRKEPANADAAKGLGRIVAARADSDEALREAAEFVHPLGRYTFSTVVFIEAANQLAGRIAQTRAAWEEGRVSREAFYKAVVAYGERVARLVSLITTSPPPPESIAEIEKAAHRRRVLAGSLLSQSVGALTAHLETGDQAAGVRARTLLAEFLAEMKQSQDPPRIPIPAKPVGAPTKP
ncbi:MAG: tetratricopeptide repeat protein [Armatimonadota bacterium]